MGKPVIGEVVVLPFPTQTCKLENVALLLSSLTLRETI
jgi:hypothetical protein